MKAIAPIVPAASVAVELIDGHPTTTSLDIAAHFGKLHKDVLKRIANLDCSPEFTQRNFAPCTRPGSNNKPEPYYRMTRDGFTFLCMGFTGKEAAKWKEAYINAFNQLEQALSAQSTPTISRDSAFEQRAFNGRPILIAYADGEPWLSAGNLCTALNLGSSDRIVRSLVTQHKRKLRHGKRDLWMVDAIGAERAADYCKTEAASEFRQWLQRVQSERADSSPPQHWAGEQAALHDLPTHTEKQLSQVLLHSRFLMHFDVTGKMHIKLIDPAATIVNANELADYIGDPHGAPRGALPSILDAVSQRMKALG